MMLTDKERCEQRTQMLMVANHLQTRAESAYMEHDDVCMTPREVSALADDIKRWADLIDRPTCNDVGDDWEFHCSACGCELDILEMEVGEPTMWKDGAAQVPKYCPSCGAEVVTTSD